MKVRYCILFYLVFACAGVRAQESRSVFDFLNLSTSSHAIALGGRNVSLIENDASLVFQNPALLSSVDDNTINFNFLSYMQGAKLGSAAFVKTAGERGTWGVGTQFLGYGSMPETTSTGEVLGDTKALDMAVSGMYSYSLNDFWVGAVTAKFIYSKYGPYSSIGLATDLSINYFDEKNDFATSLVAANLGGQVKAFADVHERIPFNLQWGFTKGMAHAPIRFSVTLTDLTHWSKKYYFNADKEPSFGRIFMNHLNLGIDIVPTDRFYVAVGYNFRRAYELKAAGSSRFAGFTCGAGLNIKKFQLGLAYAKYHVSSPCFSVSLGYSIQ